MTTKQQPIGTGFTASSTASEVLAGINLSGKNIIITGGHSGLGLEATRVLSKAGASVTVGSRYPERAAASLKGIERVEISQLDLMDPLSIKSFAARWIDSNRPLHILINCAGLPGPAERVVDARGYESQFSTNYLGHFQLSLELFTALRDAHGARIVNVSSGAQRFAEIRWDDPNFTTGYNRDLAYAQSKRAVVLLAVELDRRWAEFGIRAYSVHPGVIVGTPLNSAVGEEALRAMGLVGEDGQPIIDPEHGKKNIQQGASTIVFAASSPLLAEIGGVYLKDNDISALNDEPIPVTAQNVPSDITSASIDPNSARRLWDLGEKMLQK